MHSYKTNTAIFHYNQDLSGEVIVNCEDKDGKSQEVYIDGQDILEFVAEYVRLEKISQLEDADTRELLGLQDDHIQT